MKTKTKVSSWWRYFIVFTIVWVSGPTLQFMSQALRGYPLDINYFWSELSPDKVLKLGFYNGEGGADWKIGKPKVNIWNAEELRSVEDLRKFALELVNRDRTLNNLQPLVEVPLLSEAAQNHAQDMLTRQYFDHISPDGKNPRDRYLAVGGSPRLGIGENIVQSSVKGLGLSYGEAEDFQRGWMYSNGHRANVLNRRYTKFGYGITTHPNGEVYAVQMFSN
ncbi:CAP domain-containing protein [Cronbergia sp. UHCC 0137]|uniref:CAP domain-containing protein n=1 Tax=Cronbergia sp. UHCC 0137 TaxID=3110239 RepID=UPI002B215AD0|nr:CAP domain-containing protein [Cronbergia sp. UHCC 0137]MEA5619188.1 CAP domain-containing protein [Cronbergia sp. UHCC 0137]